MMATPSSSNHETQSGVTKRLQSEVTCPLCLDIFTEPKRLPCEHVYCRQCLRGLALRSITGSISCPECRMDIPIPNNDVANFSTPHQVNRLIELYQENLRAMETKVAEPRPATCKVHNSQPLALYCETCQRLVCRDCVIMTCAKQNHEHGYVDKMVEKYRADLNGELEPVRKLYEELSLSLDAVSAAGKELQSKQEAKLEKIRAMFDDLAKMLAKEQQHLTDSITKSFQEQEDTNSNKKLEISGMLKQLKSLIQEVESDSPNAEFLTCQAKKVKSIRDLKAAASKVSPQPVKLPEMEVELMNLTEFENEVLRTKNFVFVKDDPLKSHIAWPSPHQLFTNKVAEAVLHLNPLNVRKTFFGGIPIVAQLSFLSNGSTEEVHVKKISADRYTLSFIPKRRGKHELCIKYNNTHICGSPIPLDVSPDREKRISEQIYRLNYISHGIACFEDRLYLSAQDDSKLVILDCVSKAVLRTTDIPYIDHMAIDGNHIFATATYYHKVLKIDMDGRIIHSIELKGYLKGEFDSPSGIRLGKNNHLYVCTDNDRIQVLDKNLSLIQVYKVDHPTDLDFDSEGNLYVIDGDYSGIKKLNSAGKHIDTFTTRKWDRLMQEYIDEVRPCSIAVHRDMVYALDAEDGVYIFTTTGQFMDKVGGDYMFEYLQRKLEIYRRLNWYMAIDEDGYVYLSANNYMITCHVSAKSFHIS